MRSSSLEAFQTFIKNQDDDLGEKASGRLSITQLLFILSFFTLSQLCQATAPTFRGWLVPMKEEWTPRPSGSPPQPPRSDVWPHESQITVRLLRLYSLSAPLVL